MRERRRKERWEWGPWDWVGRQYGILIMLFVVGIIAWEAAKWVWRLVAWVFGIGG